MSEENKNNGKKERDSKAHYCHIDSAASAISSWASKGVIEKFWK